MTIQTSLGRRNFLVSGTAVAGGLSLGFNLPFTDGAAHAAEVQELYLRPEYQGIGLGRILFGEA